MLGLSEKTVEQCKDKYEIFKAFRTWEDARKANIFPQELKEEMQIKENLYHLERIDDHSWMLYSVTSSGERINPRKLVAR